MLFSPKKLHYKYTVIYVLGVRRNRSYLLSGVINNYINNFLYSHISTDYIFTQTVPSISGDFSLLPYGIVDEPYPIRILAADFLIYIFF